LPNKIFHKSPLLQQLLTAQYVDSLTSCTAVISTYVVHGGRAFLDVFCYTWNWKHPQIGGTAPSLVTQCQHYWTKCMDYTVTVSY